MVLLSPLDVRIIDNLSPPDWWNIGFTGGAAILGAIIGAGIAFLIARQTARENRDAIQSARRQTEEAATLRLIVKWMELVNSIAGYHFNMERTIKAGTEDAGDAPVETWMVLLPQIGKPQEVHIDPDELIAFTRSREFDFVTELLRLCSRHNSAIYGVEAYGNRREALMAMITPEIMDQIVSGGAWQHAELRPLMPYILPIRMLADQIREEAKSLYADAIKLQPSFRPTIQKYFSDPKFPFPGFETGKAPEAP